MSASVVSPTTNVSAPSGQPIVYKLSTTTTPWTDDHRFIVVVKEEGAQIGKFYLARNPQSVAFFDLNQIAQSRLNRPYLDNAGDFMFTASGGDTLSKSWGGMLEYTVEVGEWDGSSESLNEDSESLYVYDGVVYPKKQAISTGVFFTPSNLYQSFQTIRPAVNLGGYVTVYMDMTDDEWLMVPTLNTTNSQAVSVYWYLYDGTSTNSVTVPLTDGGVLPASQTTGPEAQLYIPVGPATVRERSGISWNSNWTTLTTELFDSSGSLNTRIIVRRACPSPKHTPTQVLFANDVGGYDSLRFDHVTEETAERNSKAYRPLLKDFSGASYTYDAMESYDTPYVVEYKEKLLLRGYFAVADNVAIKNMLRSRRIFATRPGTTNEFVPVSILTKSVKVRPELQSRMYEVSMELQISIEPVC